MVASIGTLPGNILSLTDSQFESGTPTWKVSGSNTGSLGVSTTQAFEGTHSLTWAAIAAGSTAVYKDGISASVGQPYIASAYMYLPAGATAFVELAWYNGSSFTYTYGPTQSNLTASPAWVPVYAAGICPAGTTGLDIVLVVNSTSVGAGTVMYADMVYLGVSQTQMLVDWTTPAFTATQPASPMFTDITPFLNIQTAPITVTRGRQDASSEVQPGSLTFTVDNTSGWFTQGSANTPWGSVTLGSRVQWNQAYLTSTSGVYGAFQTRFDGSINEFDYTLAPAGPSYTMAQVICKDVIGYLNQSRALNSWTVETALLDGPDYYWPLDEPTGSTQAREIVQSGPLALKGYQGNSPSSGSFGGTANAVETMSNATATVVGPYSSPISGWGQSALPLVTSGASGAGAEPLVINLPQNYMVTGSPTGWSLEWWATPDPNQPNAFNATTNTSRQTYISFSNEARVYVVQLLPSGTSQTVSVIAYAMANAWNNTWTNVNQSGSSGGVYALFNTVPLANHYVMTCATNGTLQLWQDGVLIQTDLPTDLATLKGAGGLNTITIGSATQQLYPTGNGFAGNIAGVGLYSKVLTSTQIINHCSRGQYGMYGLKSGSVINQLSQYVGLPSFWLNNSVTSGNTGLSLLDYMPIQNTNALQNMQYAEQVEQGLLFSNASGQLCFSSRALRMAMGSADYTLPIGSFTSDLGATVTDQYIQTAAAFAGNASPAVGEAYSTAATRLGSYTPNGSRSQPVTLPILTNAPKNPTPGQSVPYAVDLANWSVNSNDSAPFKAKNLTLDLLTQHVPTDPEFIAPSTVASFDINTVLAIATTETLPTLPANTGGKLDMIVEGITETVQLGVHTIQVYTSPASIWRCWIPGDATWGVLGQTTVLGISQEPNNKSTNVAWNSWDPGFPYLVPTFSATMNEGEGAVGFIGATDLRGIAGVQSLTLNPPIFAGGQGFTASGTGSSWTVPTTVINVMPSLPVLDTWSMATGQIGPTAVNDPHQGGWVAPVGGVYEFSAYQAWETNTGSVGTANFGYLAVTDWSTGVANTWDLGFTVTPGWAPPPSFGGNEPGSQIMQGRGYVPAGAIVSLQSYNHGPATGSAGIHLGIRYLGQSTTFLP